MVGVVVHVLVGGGVGRVAKRKKGKGKRGKKRKRGKRRRREKRKEKKSRNATFIVVVNAPKQLCVAESGAVCAVMG